MYLSHPDILPITFPVSLQVSPELGQGDEPRGSTREESGGDVHSAEGPSAAHAEEDGVKRECLWAGCRVPAALKLGGAVQPPPGSPRTKNQERLRACGLPLLSGQAPQAQSPHVHFREHC